MSKKKQTSKKLKQQSVKEFKAWLAGMLEFQPDEWVPSFEQWKTIQERINNLQEEIVAAPVGTGMPVTLPYSPPMSAQPPVVYPGRPNVVFDTQPNALLDEDDGEVLMDTSHFPKAPVKMGPVAVAHSSLLPAAPMPAGTSMRNVSSTTIPVKTAHIDSSQGYKSSFA
jgi:hypothetical protein